MFDAVGAFFRRLLEKLGFRYLATIATVYGLNQGLGDSLFRYASNYVLTVPRSASF